MSTLKETLEKEKILAMKAKRGMPEEGLAYAEARLSAIRSALTAISKAETSTKDRKDLSDEEVVVVLRKEVAQREDAEKVYSDAGEIDRQMREFREGEVLRAFLPALLDEVKTKALVEEIVAEAGVTGPKAIGVVMGKLKNRSDVDKGLASRFAKELLNG